MDGGIGDIVRRVEGLNSFDVGRLSDGWIVLVHMSKSKVICKMSVCFFEMVNLRPSSL